MLFRSCNVMSCKIKERLSLRTAKHPSWNKLELNPGDRMESLGTSHTACYIWGREPNQIFEIVETKQEPLLSREGHTGASGPQEYSSRQTEWSRSEPDHTTHRETAVTKRPAVLNGVNESALGRIHFDQDPSVTAVEGSPHNVLVALKRRV